MLAPIVESILVALKASDDMIVNCHCCHSFARSETYDCQLQQLTESIESFRFDMSKLYVVKFDSSWKA